MSFNLPADFTKKMLCGLWFMTTCRMMSNRRTNLIGSKIASRNYMRLVLPVMALLVFMGSAAAQSLPEPLVTLIELPDNICTVALPNANTVLVAVVEI